MMGGGGKTAVHPSDKSTLRLQNPCYYCPLAAISSSKRLLTVLLLLIGIQTVVVRFAFLLLLFRSPCLLGGVDVQPGVLHVVCVGWVDLTSVSLTRGPIIAASEEESERSIMSALCNRRST